MNEKTYILKLEEVIVEGRYYRKHIDKPRHFVFEHFPTFDVECFISEKRLFQSNGNNFYIVADGEFEEKILIAIDNSCRYVPDAIKENRCLLKQIHAFKSMNLWQRLIFLITGRMPRG